MPSLSCSCSQPHTARTESTARTRATAAKRRPRQNHVLKIAFDERPCNSCGREEKTRQVSTHRLAVSAFALAFSSAAVCSRWVRAPSVAPLSSTLLRRKARGGFRRTETGRRPGRCSTARPAAQSTSMPVSQTANSPRRPRGESGGACESGGESNAESWCKRGTNARRECSNLSYLRLEDLPKRSPSARSSAAAACPSRRERNVAFTME